MTTQDNTAYKFAEDVMALIDENPSEPLSIDRKWLLEKLEVLVAQYSDRIDNERDTAYQLGVEDGEASMQEQMEEEYDQQIQDLEERITELETELDKAYAEGVDRGVALAQNDSY